MLLITIPSADLWDELREEFLTVKEQTLQLEHSLVSISKWEAKWHKPFLTKRKKNTEEVVDYVRCMTLTQHVDPMVYACLSSENYHEIEQYIEDPMTATTFDEYGCDPPKSFVVTAEVIYAQMIEFGIPIEFQKWHLNRLLTLIRVCAIRHGPPKELSRAEILQRNAAINASRRERWNTKG